MRRCRSIAWSLAAGAVLTVGLAWGCALWSDVRADETLYATEGPLPARAPKPPAEWLVPKFPENSIGGWYDESRGFGLRYWALYVSEKDTGPIHGVQSQHTLMEWRAGWPMKAVKCGAKFDAFPWKLTRVRGGFVPPLWMHPKFRDEFATTEAYLPLVPVGLGLAVDSVLYGAAVLAVCEGLAAARRGLHRRAGRCPWCGYDLRGHVGVAAAACPECGASAPSK